MKPLHYSLNIPEDQTVFVKEELMESFYPFFHKHVEYQLAWIAQGQGKLVVENSYHDFESGDIFLIGSNQAHVFKIEDMCSTIRIVSVFFDLRGALDYIFTLPELRGLKSFIKKQNQGFKVPKACVKDVRNSIERLQQSEGIERLVGFIYLLKHLNFISEEIIPLTRTVMLQSQHHDSSIKIVSICKYIQDHFRDDISLDELAEKANLTPQAFCRFFKKSTGKTFITYLNQLRVEEVCRLLVNDKYTGISIIAFNSGFRSLTNFNRVFRTMKGVSPKDFLSKYQQTVRK